MKKCDHRGTIVGNRCFCRHPVVTGGGVDVRTTPVMVAGCESCMFSSDPPRGAVMPSLMGSVDLEAGESIENGSGVGSELVRINKKSGVKSCQQCYELAAKMNEWGPSGCRVRIDEIIEEILPRARAWSRKRVFGWLVPESMMSGEIRKRIMKAIEIVESQNSSQAPAITSGSTSTGLG